MGLLDTDKIARILHRAGSKPLWYPITLRKRDVGETVNFEPVETFVDVPGRGFLDTVSSFRRATENIPSDKEQFMLMQHDLVDTSGVRVEPSINDRLIARGVEYVIETVSEDPARATWTLMASRVSE